MITFLIKCLAAYVFFSLILSIIPVNTKNPVSLKEKTIYITTNGVHTDIILSLEETEMPWNEILNNQKLSFLWPLASHISFGWGDKGFYLNTPRWKDLKFQTAFTALLLNSPSAMHVTLLKKPEITNNTKRVKLSKGQFRTIEQYIFSSFKISGNNTAYTINHPGYGASDSFFASKLSFNIFNTCNVWTNRALKEAGIRSSFWTPYDKPILYHLPSNPN